MPDRRAAADYLDGLVNTILVKDVMVRQRATNAAMFRDVAAGVRAGPDTGHLLENAFFLELRRRHGKVWTGRAGAGDIDFVVESGDSRVYLQVAATVRDPQTLSRELAPLLAVRDHHPKLLLTLDEDPPATHQGVRQLNAVDWLLGDQPA
jgi:predicted AAA+ superfamily ATPase